MPESLDPALVHRRRPMIGRDPHEQYRASTPLELLFDLTFVVAFGTAASSLSHALAAEHIGSGILAFVFATFAVTWAWINFSWFASAFDTDDWIYRLTTMLQMVGVLVFALGIPSMFASVVDHGATLNLDIMVWGYVVMRIAMLLQWWRAGRHDPERREVCISYSISIFIAQVLWCVIAIIDLSVTASFVALLIPFLVELAGPGYAETHRGGTPWHAHHIAERYGLMVIITLGEGILGTMVTLTALAQTGLTWDLGLLALAGTALSFGIWWSYFVVPNGEVLHAHRERSFGWGYGHMLVFGSIVGVGAGLHTAAYYLQQESQLSLVASVSSVVVPVAVFTVMFYAGYSLLTRSFHSFHLLLLAISVVFLIVPLVMAAAGAGLTWCLLVLALTPWVSVVGYETVGHRHNQQILADLTDQEGPLRAQPESTDWAQGTGNAT